MIDEEGVLEVLNQTGDPELGIGIVDLGLIAKLDVETEYIRVKIRTTTPNCPFQPFIMLEVHRRLIQITGVRGAEVEVALDSPWHPGLMSESAKTRLGFIPQGLQPVHVAQKIKVEVPHRGR